MIIYHANPLAQASLGNVEVVSTGVGNVVTKLEGVEAGCVTDSSNRARSFVF